MFLGSYCMGVTANYETAVLTVIVIGVGYGNRLYSVPIY